MFKINLCILLDWVLIPQFGEGVSGVEIRMEFLFPERTEYEKNDRFRRNYRVSSRKKMSWFWTQNFSLALARNKFSVLFKRERFNDCSAEFANYLSKFFLLNAVRNWSVPRIKNAHFSIALFKNAVFPKKWLNQIFRSHFVHKTYCQYFTTKKSWFVIFIFQQNALPPKNVIFEKFRKKTSNLE